MLVLVILAGVWAAVLVPPYLRSRSETRPATSISSFRQHLSTLERTMPGARAVPPARLPVHLTPISTRPAAGVPVGRAEVRRRRREILFTLAGAAAITLLLALTMGGMAIAFHLLADVLLAGYVTLLVQLRRAAADREAKVRYLPARSAAPEPALLLRRSASSP